MPVTKTAVNHKKLVFTAAFETLKSLYFRKLSKTKPMPPPSGKHMGLYTIYHPTFPSKTFPLQQNCLPGKIPVSYKNAYDVHL